MCHDSAAKGLRVGRNEQDGLFLRLLMIITLSFAFLCPMLARLPINRRRATPARAGNRRLPGQPVFISRLCRAGDSDGNRIILADVSMRFPPLFEDSPGNELVLVAFEHGITVGAHARS